jgi:hypothetical protein
MKILIAIVSCQRDRALQQAQRDTWLKDLQAADYCFFLGAPLFKPETDEVSLAEDDSYAGLARKTQAICEMALLDNYDRLFKCDIDTVVNPQLLLQSCAYDGYAGAENEDLVPGIPERIRFASGGAGYWLDRTGMRIVVGSPIRTNAEDVFVADALRNQQRYPMWLPGYKWRPGSEIDKDTVTLHLSSALQKKYEPTQMYEAYEKMRSFR